MSQHVRITRPVGDLACSVAMYKDGLGLCEVGSFCDHEGFDGVMLSEAGKDLHFEFTYCRAHPIKPSPTAEDLVVFYVPEPDVWEARCHAMLNAGFAVAEPLNPYWKKRGRTFEDPDGYRIVIERSIWRG